MTTTTSLKTILGDHDGSPRGQAFGEYHDQRAIFANHLVLKYPETVRGAVMHEPPYIGVSSDPAQVGARLQAMIEQGMAGGGPAAAMELFFRLRRDCDVRKA